MFNDLQLIYEDVLSLNLDFLKLNNLYDITDIYFNINIKEIKYECVYSEYTHNNYDELYLEAEQVKANGKKNIIGKMINSIINFIKKVRVKILRLFGKNEKADRIESTMVVEVDTHDEEIKAIEKGNNIFTNLINKVINGTATKKDADNAEKEYKSILGVIGGIIGIGTVSGAAVAHKKGWKISDLFKKRNNIMNKYEAESKKDENMLNKAKESTNQQNMSEETIDANKKIVDIYQQFVNDKSKVYTKVGTDINSAVSNTSSKKDETGNGESSKSIEKEKPSREVQSKNNDTTKKETQKNNNDVSNKKESKIHKPEEQKEQENSKEVNKTNKEEIKINKPENYINELNENSNLSTLERRILSKFQQDDIPKKYIDRANSIKDIKSEPEKVNAIISLIDDVINHKSEIKNHYMNYYDNFIKTNKDGSAKSLFPNGLPDAERRFNTYINTLSNAKDKLIKKSKQDKPKETENPDKKEKNSHVESSEEQKEFDKYKEENETLKQEIRGYINNKNNIKIAYLKQQKFYATEKDYNIKLKGQRHPEIKPSMTLEKIKEYNQKFKNHRDEIKESYEMRMKISEDENKEKTPNKVEKNLETQNNTEKKYNGHGHDEIAPLQGEYKAKIYSNVHEISSPSIGNELTSEEKEIAKKLYDKSKNKTLTYGDLDQIEKLYKKYKDNTSSSFSCPKKLSTLLTDPDFTQHLTNEEKIKLEEIDNRVKNKTTIRSDNTYVINLYKTIYNKLSNDVKKQRREKNKSTKTSKNETDQSKDSQVESDESKTQDDTSNKKNKCADFKNQPSDVKSLVKDAHILMSTVKDFVKTYFKIRIKSGGYDFYLLDEKQGEEILRHVGLYEQGSFIGRLDAGNKKYEAAVNDVINYSEYVLKFKDKYSSKEFYKAKGQESKYDDDDYESEDEDVEEVYEEIEEKLKKVKKQLPALKNVMFESSYDLINDILTIFENSFL